MRRASSIRPTVRICAGGREIGLVTATRANLLNGVAGTRLEWHCLSTPDLNVSGAGYTGLQADMALNVDALLETRDITKSYGTNRVLSDVRFHLAASESVAIIGENGAGKSTLAKILTGVIRPDSGSVLLRGRPVVFSSPRDALQHGIAFIPQELAYVPHLTVAENILLGRWPNWHGLTTRSAALRRAHEECDCAR